MAGINNRLIRSIAFSVYWGARGGGGGGGVIF